MKAEPTLPVAYARVVVDTNVLLSAALLPQRVPAVLVDRLLRDGGLVFSKPTFAELETRIWKPKFDRYLSMETRRDLLRDFDASASWVTVPEEIAQLAFSRDASDDIFVQTALAANAHRLITGDEDLLVLHSVDALHIVTPRVALQEIIAFQGQ